jgi:UDP-glucose 4-epimerase
VKVVVSGAAGFIGRRVVALLSGEHEVVGLDLRAPEGEIAGRAEWIECDLARLDAAALPDRADAVVHLAQSLRYRELPDGAADVFDVNVGSTFRLLEYARRASAESFVLASTGGLYERSPEPLAESASIRPADLYFRSKHLAEQLLEEYAGAFRTVALRLFFVYGPGPSRMLIRGLAESIHAGETITIEGERGLRLQPTYVDDAARAFELAIGAGGGRVFNVAGDDALSLAELIELIAERSGREAIVEHEGPDPAGGLLADTSRIKRELGYAPRVGLREGIDRMLDSAGLSAASRAR